MLILSIPLFVTSNVSAYNLAPLLSENVYRYRNVDLESAHFYVMGYEERKQMDEFISVGGKWEGKFVNEGVAFKAYRSEEGICPGETISVYRFLNNIYGSAHFYVVGDDNKNIVINNSAPGGAWDGTFTFEGVSFCAYTEGDNVMRTSVHRFRNESLGGTVHFFLCNWR
ncbi:MAG: hypothetical protein Q9M91_07155 [Candidatus Dojkabacteria bacterium]|nr:hypothetical protein [Candidatus Dojkabacteria bacterium]MDQ7021569.1 hypothetical protein [Candidatus Dojkabacteria bacterium]